jgi:hypothetical protein
MRITLHPAAVSSAFTTASRLAGLYDKWAGRVGAEDWTKVQQTRPL